MTLEVDEQDDMRYRPLRTSRGSEQREVGVLAALRGLVPLRSLESQQEAERVAELQASRFLELAGLTDPPVPSELIADLPRIRVQRDVDLPASGSATWQNGRWLLTVNGAEPWTRQRFSLAHEFKHVLDHPLVWVYDVAGTDAEAVADYFAACLLMPKPAVKRLFYGGVQQLSALSEAFEVSPPAMARRLNYLGLRMPTPRTGPRVWPPAGQRSDHTYYRARTPLLEVAV